MTLQDTIKDQIKKIDTLDCKTKYRITAKAQKTGMKSALKWVLEILEENEKEEVK